MFQFITNLKVYDNIMKKPAEFISNLVSVKSDKFQISFAVPSINLENLAGLFPGKIMAQHVDLNPPGPYTGSIPMESLLTYGINGSLLNHSEKRIQSEIITNIIKKAESLNFELVVCCENLNEIKLYSSMGARTIAYEPPELIGGNISVSSAKPEIIDEGVKICERDGASLLVGAGVKTREDVELSIKLGAQGILIASGITRAPDPRSALNSLTLS